MTSSPSTVLATLPSASLFQFPPNSQPTVIPPPPTGFANGPMFHIPEHIYQAALDPKVPLTIAAVYAVVVKLLNKHNKATGKKAWAISQTKLFFAFVVLHNIFLAAYSAWTWWGMLGALRRSIVSPTGPNGLAGTVDSFCRLTGSPGLGNAAFYDDETNEWQSYGGAAALTADGPSRTAQGRIWNEGLAFYGWLFYLSKFYEVLDTLIILAKGKLSSTLQTYHHAGAMMCMWAGMRYTSAPIWMFVFVNSGIHAMMYTYYTITAFSIKVPMAIKRTLTTLQITQFLVGATYAMVHSFVSYTIPVVTTVAEKVAAGTPSQAASAEAVQGLWGHVKNLMVNAAAHIPQDQAATGAAAGSVSSPVAQQATYSQKVVPCITSAGETFAIWLNVLYLAPLTYLFVSFFIASYMRRSSAESARAKKADADAKVRRESNVTLAEKATWDAAKGLEREVYGDASEKALRQTAEDAGVDAAIVGGGSPNRKATRSKGRANGKVKR